MQGKIVCMPQDPPVRLVSPYCEHYEAGGGPVHVHDDDDDDHD